MFLDAGPGKGSFPWWVFLMMPLMMLGMGVMMWLMMRMMMGMDDHSQDGGAQPGGEQSTRPGESEADELRRQVSELQGRLAAMESQAPRSDEGDDP